MYCYLSAPVDYAPDRGQGWRDIITEKLFDIGMPKNHILSPLNKPIQNISANLSNEGELLDEYRAKRDWDGLINVMSEIVHVDLRLIDISSFVIACFPLDDNENRIPAYFTLGELHQAKQQRKPIFVIWPGGIETCSGYVMWLAGYENIFETDDELVDRLDSIRSGDYPYNSKDWLLLDLLSAETVV